MITFSEDTSGKRSLRLKATSQLDLRSLTRAVWFSIHSVRVEVGRDPGPVLVVSLEPNGPLARVLAD